MSKPIDQGIILPKPKKSTPLQLKRGSSRAFATANIVLLDGQPAFETDTKKLKIGDGKTKYNSLIYIGDNNNTGKSAYEVWLDEGYTGSVNDFLDFLTGDPGKSAYEIWLSLSNEGTMQDFIDSLKGDEGKSTYQSWLDCGHSGTEEDFVNSLTSTSWGKF